MGGQWRTTTANADAGRGSTWGWSAQRTPSDALVAVGLGRGLRPDPDHVPVPHVPRPHTIDYSNFLERVEAGQIVGTLEISQTTVSGRYEDSTGTVDFNSTIPPILQGTSTLTDQLDAAGINYTGVTPNSFQTILIGWVVPLLLFGFLWFFLVRRMSGAQAGRR